MQSDWTIQDYLAEALPAGLKIRAYHVSTSPDPSPAIFSPHPGQDEERTFCESHFLGIASPQTGSHGEVFVFAIEVLIFTTSNLTTLFVSKADSTGFASRLNTPRGSPSVISATTKAFLDFLVKPRISKSRLVMSLFARSQNQYLFPGSIDNQEKHVLDDRQLIKWWCRVLDSVWRQYDADQSPAKITAHVVVPGCDKSETRAFFPASAKQDNPAHPRWSPSYPVHLMLDNTDLPTRCLIPRLPDDPKARFLGDLDGDYVGDAGEWRNIRSLAQFWEMMSYRQECSAGRLVGFVWIVFSIEMPKEAPGRKSANGSSTVAEDKSLEDGTIRTLAQSHVQSNGDREAIPLSNDNLQPAGLPNSLPSASRSLEIQHSPQATLDGDPNGQQVFEAKSYYDEARSEPVRWPDSTKGQAIIDPEDYQSLMDYILELDFDGIEAAVQSTKEWVDHVSKLSSLALLGIDITGRRTLGAGLKKSLDGGQQVNMLTAVRKKRKPAEVETDSPVMDVETNTLSANLVRKKKKADISS